MIRSLSLLRLSLFLGCTFAAVAQQQPGTTTQGAQPDAPVANPGRPTVATPATLTPVGYFQFETGFLAAWHSPEVSYQGNLNEVVKFSVSRWIELLVEAEPYAHSHAEGAPTNAPGGVALGIQGIIHHGEGARPTIALSYFGQVYSGEAPDLDIGSFTNSVLLLASADVKAFTTTPIISSTKSFRARFAAPSSGRRSRFHTPSEGSLGSPERYGTSRSPSSRATPSETCGR